MRKTIKQQWHINLEHHLLIATHHPSFLNHSEKKNTSCRAATKYQKIIIKIIENIAVIYYILHMEIDIKNPAKISRRVSENYPSSAAGESKMRKISCQPFQQ